jgi:predicted O-methyltransferase YrrM
MNSQIEKIYQAGEVTGRTGVVHKLHSEIDRGEGEFLSRIIAGDATIRRTLEIGCAYGLSSLFICSALAGRPGALHTIVDPFQNSQWDGVGTKNLEEAGLSFFQLIEEKSEFALPQILKQGEGQYDFIFIDGWHTFDHTLLDAYYATRLLRVGGYLVIDDASWTSIHRVVSYLKNYPCYQTHDELGEDWHNSPKKLLARTLMSPLSRHTWATILHPSLHRRLFEKQAVSMVALKKVAADARNWDWHADSF